MHDFSVWVNNRFREGELMVIHDPGLCKTPAVRHVFVFVCFQLDSSIFGNIL